VEIEPASVGAFLDRREGGGMGREEAILAPDGSILGSGKRGGRDGWTGCPVCHGSWLNSLDLVGLS